MNEHRMVKRRCIWWVVGSAMVIAASGCSNEKACSDAREKAAAALQDCFKANACAPGMDDTAKAKMTDDYKKSGTLGPMMSSTSDESYKRLVQLNADAKKICEAK